MGKRPCKCGGEIKDSRCLTEGFLVDCLECDKCGDRFYTMGQAKELLRLRQANKEIESRRKIIKVGDSIAATLPKKIMKYGIKEGAVEGIRVLSADSIEIKFKRAVF